MSRSCTRTRVPSGGSNCRRPGSMNCSCGRTRVTSGGLNHWLSKKREEILTRRYIYWEKHRNMDKALAWGAKNTGKTVESPVDNVSTGFKARPVDSADNQGNVEKPQSSSLPQLPKQKPKARCSKQGKVASPKRGLSRNNKRALARRAQDRKDIATQVQEALCRVAENATMKILQK